MLPKPFLHCLFKLWSKIPNYCKSYVRKGKSDIKILALTAQKPAWLSWQTCEFLTHTPHQTHSYVHTETNSGGKIREDLPARGKCLPFSPHRRLFFYSWSKLLQIATENRNSGENNSVIKYANSGLPKYQGWKKKADLSKIQNSSSALSHAAKSKAYEHTNYTMNINASLFLPQSF